MFYTNIFPTSLHLLLLKHSDNLAYKIKDLPLGGRKEQVLKEKQVSEEMTTGVELAAAVPPRGVGARQPSTILEA